MLHLIDLQLQLILLGEVERAGRLSDQLDRDIPNNLRHRFNRGWFLLNRGDLQTGYKLMEAGRELEVYGNKLPDNFTAPKLMSADDVSGNTVLLFLEGGYGDQFIYIRFARTIKELGGTCIICASEHMHSFYSRIEGVSKCVTLEAAHLENIDYVLHSFSAPWVLGFTYKTLINKPYITPISDRVDVTRDLFASLSHKVTKVGIKWSGNPKFEHQQFRKFPPQKLFDACRVTGVKLYSLQKDFDQHTLPKNAIDLQYILNTWEETAAIISHLDLVITSCTSIAHLAGAMGKPVWVIVPALPYHIWAYGDHNVPWYPDTTVVIRQKKLGQWDDVFNVINKNLINIANINSSY